MASTRRTPTWAKPKVRSCTWTPSVLMDGEAALIPTPGTVSPARQAWRVNHPSRYRSPFVVLCLLQVGADVDRYDPLCPQSASSSHCRGRYAAIATSLLRCAARTNYVCRYLGSKTSVASADLQVTRQHARMLQAHSTESKTQLPCTLGESQLLSMLDAQRCIGGWHQPPVVCAAHNSHPVGMPWDWCLAQSADDAAWSPRSQE